MRQLSFEREVFDQLHLFDVGKPMDTTIPPSIVSLVSERAHLAKRVSARAPRTLAATTPPSTSPAASGSEGPARPAKPPLQSQTTRPTGRPRARAPRACQGAL